MKLNILSDLHLGFGMLDVPRNDADVVVLAGDVARPAQAVEWARGFSGPVLYVPGNHEFYGNSIPGALDELRRLSAGTNVCVLADDEVTIDGVRFLGSTLWTDFLLQGGGERQCAAMREGQRFMRDFTRIRLTDAPQTPFTPAASAALFDVHARWLDARLGEAHAGPTVVVTHHAPSCRSIHPRFAGSPLNACFVSDADRLLDGRRSPLWIHGHTHDSFDYVVNGTRVICNPRGYAKDGVNENALFDADFCVDIP